MLYVNVTVTHGVGVPAGFNELAYLVPSILATSAALVSASSAKLTKLSISGKSIDEIAAL